MLRNRKFAMWAAFLAALPLLLVVSPASAVTHGHRVTPSVVPHLSGATSPCNRPTLKMFGAYPDSISGPFLIGNQIVSRPVASMGPVISVSCKWKLTFNVRHHDPTVYVYTGSNVTLVPGEIDQFNANGFDGVRCAAYYQINNGFGGAAAQSALASTLCNTDVFARGEGTVTVINASLQAGPATVVAPSQNYWYGSFVLGASVLVGVFNFCSQYPVGQHNVYACIQFDAGPFA
jgi:hypothetical protein